MNIYQVMVFVAVIVSSYFLIFMLGFIIGKKVDNTPIIAKLRKPKVDKPSKAYDKYKSTNGKYAPTKVGSKGKGNKADEIDWI